jgi:MoxR-like ATPase
VSNKQIKQIELELNQKYFERREVIRGLLVALLSKQHILLLGAPGSAKSALTEDLCQRVGGIYFKKLVTKTSTPEELFGPISLQALKQDSYRRVTTGRLPEANISFIDEIFKCNSAVLNGLLGILNEREFENGGSIVKVPLQFLAGASNELPEDREELGALWDRFLLRYVVDYIRDPRNFELLLKGNLNSSAVTSLSESELAADQKEVESIDISNIIPQIFKIRDRMIELKIDISDRRWKQVLLLIKANAWIEDRKQAIEDDLEILTFALWQEPDQITTVKKEIMNLCNPFDREALDLHDQAVELYQNAINAPEGKEAASAGIETNSKLKQIIKKLEELQQATKGAGKSDSRIAGYLEKVSEYNKAVVNKCLGV